MNPYTFNFREDHIVKILDTNSYAGYWYDALYKILPVYDITTIYRVACFLGQCAHESNNFNVIQENLNYRAESLLKFPKYFKTLDEAKKYAHQPEKIANKMYGNRMGNGNEASGDGWRYRGRGILQITGKSNYQDFADSIDSNLADIPDYLATFEGSVQAACWYWETKNINIPADKMDNKEVTLLINGGLNGYDDRVTRTTRALRILRT